MREVTHTPAPSNRVLRRSNPDHLGPRNECIFSVDVEDWFHILDIDSAPPLAAWDSLPSRVEDNFRRLLDLFATQNCRVTCFFLGWVGARFPGLVKEAVNQGHEIASHGYSHQLTYRMTHGAFREDATSARKCLEDIAGSAIRGYRAAGFSATKDTPWFFEALLEAGYEYDSSLFPGARGHGGIVGGCRRPHKIACSSGTLIEFPITVADCLGRPMCFFGGGYLRVFPYWLIKRMASRVLREPRPVVFYVHPREIDSSHPRLPMGWKRRFKSYYNLDTTEVKIGRILRDFRLIRFDEFLAKYDRLLEFSVEEQPYE